MRLALTAHSMARPHPPPPRHTPMSLTQVKNFPLFATIYKIAFEGAPPSAIVGF